MPTDTELLRRYAEEKSEAAFGELVRRQVNLVYTVALRRCGGDVHLAEDVTQRVFTDLARKARQLSGHAVLGGWLYRSTQFAASDVVRTERRRRVREAEAHAMQEIAPSDARDTDWARLTPVLVAVIDELPAADRDAVVLRFFEGKPFAEIGSALRLSDDAARMRVDRALARLHRLLTRRGLTSTTAALALALGHQAVAAAPTGLATSVTSAALAGAVATGATASLGGTLAFMASLKLPLGVTAVLLVAGTAGLLTLSQDNAALHAEVAALRQSLPSAATVAGLRAENQQLAATAAEIEVLRRDDAELAHLQAAAAAVKARQRQAAQVTADARAKRAAELAALPVYSASQVDQRPKARSQVVPDYPAAFLPEGRPGEATVSFVVNADGAIVDVRAEKYSHPEFAAAAVAAVQRWQFDPGKKDGTPVNVRQTIPILFRPKGTPASQPSAPRSKFWF